MVILCAVKLRQPLHGTPSTFHAQPLEMHGENPPMSYHKTKSDNAWVSACTSTENYYYYYYRMPSCARGATWKANWAGWSGMVAIPDNNLTRSVSAVQH